MSRRALDLDGSIHECWYNVTKSSQPSEYNDLLHSSTSQISRMLKSMTINNITDLSQLHNAYVTTANVFVCDYFMIDQL
jgi:hypothetical protein